MRNVIACALQPPASHHSSNVKIPARWIISVKSPFPCDAAAVPPARHIIRKHAGERRSRGRAVPRKRWYAGNRSHRLRHAADWCRAMGRRQREIIAARGFANDENRHFAIASALIRIAMGILANAYQRQIPPAVGEYYYDQLATNTVRWA